MVTKLQVRAPCCFHKWLFTLFCGLFVCFKKKKKVLAFFFSSFNLSREKRSQSCSEQGSGHSRNHAGKSSLRAAVPRCTKRKVFPKKFPARRRPVHMKKKKIFKKQACWSSLVKKSLKSASLRHFPIIPRCSPVVLCKQCEAAQPRLRPRSLGPGF